MRKSTMLQVTGILLIIFSVFSIFMGIFEVISTFFTLTHKELVQLAGENIVKATISSFLDLFIGIYQLAMGIIGVISSNKPKKGKKCFVIGFIAIALIIISIV